MAAKPKEYQRLPGRGIRRDGWVSVSVKRTRLWLGPDHLLAVDSRWYSEDYRRFYFRDIQAIIIRKTNNGRTTNFILSLPAFATLFAAFITTDGVQVFWFILTAAFAFFILLNTFVGPTCVCHLRTAVQTEEIPSLRRLRRARKVLARVRPFIIAAQGELAPEEIAARLAPPAASPAPVGGEVPAPGTPPTG